MNQEGGEDVSRSIVGLSKQDAVAAVVAADESRDPDTVRAALDQVTEDGVVTEDATNAALAHVSKVVSTPETRVELAAMALSDARAAADPVADLAVVRTRLDTFEARLADVESRAADLGVELQRLLDRRDEPGTAYEVVEGIRTLTADANGVHRDADQLQLDLEAFERWLSNADARFDEFEADLDALANSLDDLETTTETVARAADESARIPEYPAVSWLDATFRHRVVALLLADLRAELAELGAWAEREDGADTGRADDAEARLDDLDARLATIGERLDTLARPEWHERFDDRLTAFETALDEFSPPVDWGEVQAELADHRSDIESRE